MMKDGFDFNLSEMSILSKTDSVILSNINDLNLLLKSLLKPIKIQIAHTVIIYM